jgi:2-keto-3-deoxy-L-rhamnonate aldolase RhmA
MDGRRRADLESPPFEAAPMTPRSNPFLDRLRRGEPTLMMAIRHARTPEIVRIARSTGHHAIMVDLEHAAIPLDVAGQMCAAAGDLGLFAFVRIPERDYGSIGRLLDSGGAGIVAPRIGSAAEAETIARACRFPPQGQRSVLAQVPQLGMTPTPAREMNPRLDAFTVVQVLLETPAGIAAADAIAALPGVDMIAIGANDLTGELGIPGDSETLADYIEDEGNPAASFNAIMIATFFLVSMDIGHRVMTWLQRHAIDWSRAQVLITGKQGRPTAGVTIASNSVCAMIIGASGYALPLDQLFIAPHAPAATLPPGAAPAAVAALEQPMRALWAYTRAISDVAALMFPDQPAYSAAAAPQPEITQATRTLADMPRINGPDDWRAMTARLRLVMEDPRQLLSGCVTDYAVQQLHACGNAPSKVVVPGLDGVVYPRRGDIG